MTITLEEFKNSFIPIRGNYVLNIQNNQTYLAIYIEDTKEVQLIEALEYDDKIENISKKADEFVDKLSKELV